MGIVTLNEKYNTDSGLWDVVYLYSCYFSRSKYYLKIRSWKEKLVVNLPNSNKYAYVNLLEVGGDYNFDDLNNPISKVCPLFGKVPRWFQCFIYSMLLYDFLFLG